MNKDFWNNRFSVDEYIYGIEPNDFFKEHIDSLKAGKILLLGEGEGKNAVYAASKGWIVDAIDFSESAKEKALKLAEKSSVHINYIVSDITEFEYPQNEYDLAGLFFIHLSTTERNKVHKKIISSLKPSGKIILEAFNKNQINNFSGGPKDINLLYDEEDILDSFKELNVVLLKTLSIELNQGNYHKGKADIIRFIGTKK